MKNLLKTKAGDLLKKNWNIKIVISKYRIKKVIRAVKEIIKNIFILLIVI